MEINNQVYEEMLKKMRSLRTALSAMMDETLEGEAKDFAMAFAKETLKETEDREECPCRSWTRLGPPFKTEHHFDCPKYEKKMIRVYTVSPGQGLNKCMEKDPENCLIWIEEADLGEEITINVSEMDEAFYNELPEYTGP